MIEVDIALIVTDTATGNVHTDTRKLQLKTEDPRLAGAAITILAQELWYICSRRALGSLWGMSHALSDPWRMEGEYGIVHEVRSPAEGVEP